MKAKVYIMSCLILGLSGIIHTVAYGQLSGVYSPGSVAYPSLASIINALNDQGVSGNVTINLPSGFTETAPAGGYILGSDKLNTGANSLSSTRKLSIVKTGTGANPVLIAPTGTGTTDAIFTLAGADYVYIDGIDLRESAANTTETTQMEWGYALLKRNTTSLGIDGCQHVSITNCYITLNKNNRNSIGIYAANHAAGSTTAVTPTTAAGAHRNDSLTGNVISNVIRGISLAGYSGGSDALLDYGYYLLGNRVENFGHAVAGIGVYPTATGIYITGSKWTYLAKNSIYNTYGGGGANMAGILYGIFAGPAAGGYLRAESNELGLVQDSTVNQSPVYGIRSEIGGAVTSGGSSMEDNTLAIINNTIEARGSMGGGGQFQLISHTGPVKYADISSNVFKNIHFNGLGNCYFINNTMNNSPDTSTIIIRDNKLDGVFRVNQIGSSAGFPGQVILINNAGNIAGALLRDTIIGNNFSNFDVSDKNPLKVQVVVGIQDNIGGTAAPFAPKIIAGNRFQNIAGVQFRAFNLTKMGVNATDTSRISHNVVKNIYGLNYGIQINATNGQVAIIENNLIDSAHNTGMSLAQSKGIVILGGDYIRINANKISRIVCGHPSLNTLVYGIHFGRVSVAEVSNNMIGFLGAPSTPGLLDFNVAGIAAERGDTIRIYHNTLNLVPAEPNKNDYSISGILFTDISDEVDIRNNIIHVDSRPLRGITAAIRRKTGDANVVPFNLALTTNGNILYAPDAPRVYVYAEGDSAKLVNAFTASEVNYRCDPYKLFMQPRELATYSEQNLSVDSDGNYTPTGSSFAKEGGVSSPVSTDFLGATRGNRPDIGALQFVGTTRGGGRLEVAALGSLSFCEGDSVLLSVNQMGATSIIWQKDGNNISGATDSLISVNESGAYRVVLNFTSGCSDTSEAVQVEVHPAPIPVITAAGPNGAILSTGSYLSYQWRLDGNDIPGAQSASHAASISGDYTVVVEDANGCKGVSAVQRVDLDPEDVRRVASRQPVIYPNPATEVVYIDYPQALSVVVSSVDGKQVLRGVYQDRIDLGALTPGIYWLQCRNLEGLNLGSTKIVILK